MLYLRLFHGREDPEQDMDNWGLDGPIFGPYEFVHTTYNSSIKLGKQNGDCDMLLVAGDMLYYDGVYYGDWSVFDDRTYRDGNYQATAIEESRAYPPQ